LTIKRARTFIILSFFQSAIGSEVPYPESISELS
jgi:hypothetical protein